MAKCDGQSGHFPPPAGGPPITLVHQGTVDDPAPPVDRELLLALVNKRLADPEAREIFRWIQTNKEWDDAYVEALWEKLGNIWGTSEREDARIMPPQAGSA